MDNIFGGFTGGAPSLDFGGTSSASSGTGGNQINQSSGGGLGLSILDWALIGVVGLGALWIIKGGK